MFRSIFGGGVGPNRRVLANGAVGNFFEGVKVRSQPLPLKVPISAPGTQQQQPAANNQTPGAATTTTTAAATVTAATATATAGATTTASSPILTNLLHRKSPGPNDENKPAGIVSRCWFTLYSKEKLF